MPEPKELVINTTPIISLIAATGCLVLEMLPKLETILERELKYRGIIKDEQPYSAGLIGWIEIVALP